MSDPLFIWWVKTSQSYFFTLCESISVIAVILLRILVILLRISLFMSILEIFHNYHRGMEAYNRCHQPSLETQWQAFKDEVAEFTEEQSIVEAWDMLHSGGRVVSKVTRIPLHLLAFPTVAKHSKRYSDRECIRSERNCQGKCCLECDR